MDLQKNACMSSPSPGRWCTPPTTNCNTTRASRGDDVRLTVAGCSRTDVLLWARGLCHY
jgi:hypothetical protein